MRRTKAFLEAKLAALESENLTLHGDLVAANREVVRLRDELQVSRQVPALQRMTLEALKEQARKWASEGVPCHIRSGHIIHSITKAVLL